MTTVARGADRFKLIHAGTIEAFSGNSISPCMHCNLQ